MNYTRSSYKGFPVGLVIFLAAAVICGIILYNTKPGRYILCLGSNSEAVRLSGVNTKKWRMLAYVICGVLVGIGAIFFVGAYTTVSWCLGTQFWAKNPHVPNYTAEYGILLDMVVFL